MIISEYSNFLYRISVNKENTLELLRPFSLDAWVALKLDRWNTHKCTFRVWYLPAISNFHPSLPSSPSSEKTFFVADGKSTQCFKSLKSIDSAGPTDLEGDSHCSAEYLKTKEDWEQDSSMISDALDLCIGQNPLQECFDVT